MKIALAFFGLPRCSRVTWPAVEKQLVAPLSNAGELRLFHHLYLQERVVNARSNEDHALDPSNYLPFGASTGTIEPWDTKALHAQVERFTPFGDAWGDGFGSLRNLLLQLHSLDAVTREALAWDPDVVVFTRPDQLHHDAVSIAHLNWAASRPERVALPWWQWWHGVNDRFAICGRSAAMEYGLRQQRAMNYCQRFNKPLHAERLLAYTLSQGEVKVIPMAMRASRVRVTGRIEEEAFEPDPQALQMLRRLKLQAETGRPGP